MKKNYIFLLVFFCTVQWSQAITITATQNGNWTSSNTSIWSPAQVPGPDDLIIIPSGIIITIPTFQVIDLRDNILSTASVITIQGSGQLRISNLAGLSMDAGDGSKIIINSVNGLLILSGPISYIRQGDSWFLFPGSINGPAVLEDGVLPIELLYFKAEQLEETVLLEWATSIEENFDFFTVERSFDGLNFENIAEIQGAGNSQGEQYYSFTDYNSLPGQLYYRLKATDFDGSFEYFDIVTVQFKRTGNSEVTLYPNPALDGQVTVHLNYKPKGPASIIIYDQTGKKFMEHTLSSQKETLLLPPEMHSGVYLINIMNAKHISQSKLSVGNY